LWPVCGHRYPNTPSIASAAARPIVGITCEYAQLKTTETGERYMISDRSRAQIAVMMAVHAATDFEDDLKIILPTGVG
jgi:hypothetical protein